MKTLVISKPIYNYIMPLQDFPKNKDVYNIDSCIETIAGEANVASYLLGKYGMDVSYSGIIGNDEAGLKFKKVLESNNINSKYIEIDYELKTNVIYSIINTEKGGFSHIKVNSMKNDLTKYKYDFTPDYIVFDDKDFSGANAALNNYPNVPSIFYGKKPDKDAINMCKRADYVVCNIDFASKLTGLVIDLNKPKTVVNLYQKLIDLFKGEWIITLGEYGVIYCNDNNVKMIPGIKVEVIDKDKSSGVFFGVFAFSIINGYGIENAVRLANIAASSSLAAIGSTNGIMDISELLKYKVQETVVDNVQRNQVVEQVQNNEVLEQNVINYSGATQVNQVSQNTINQPVSSVDNNVNVANNQPAPSQVNISPQQSDNNVQ